MGRDLKARADRELLAGGLMSVGQFIERTTLSKSAAYRLMDSGELPFVQLGRRRLIPRHAAEKLLQRGLRGCD